MVRILFFVIVFTSYVHADECGTVRECFKEITKIVEQEKKRNNELEKQLNELKGKYISLKELLGEEIPRLDDRFSNIGFTAHCVGRAHNSCNPAGNPPACPPGSRPAGFAEHNSWLGGTPCGQGHYCTICIATP